MFDLVFLDPPYRMEHTGAMCEALMEAGLLAEDALIVIEHRRGCDPALGSRITRADLRHYGDTEISFVRIAAPEMEETDGDAAVRREL